MKRLRRVIAVSVVGVLASFAFAVQAPADHTEPRFTLTIAPEQGLPGQNIHAIVPAEYREECLNANTALAAFQAIVSDAVLAQTFDPTTAEGALTAIVGGGVEGLTAVDLDNFAFLFVLAFVDPVTQDPVVDEITGEEAVSNWNAITGEGDILAPYVNPRPATYFVAAVCLDLQPIDPAAFAALIEEALTDPELQGCVPVPMSAACAEIIPAAVEEIITGLVELAVNQDPDVAWVAPFCLLNDDLANCAVPEAPAEPVAAAPTFAG